jgi:hypothetical protein
MGAVLSRQRRCSGNAQESAQAADHLRPGVVAGWGLVTMPAELTTLARLPVSGRSR